MSYPSGETSRHVPVMLAEVMAALSPRDDETHLDCTFGAGGYTHAILAAAGTRVFALDRDPQAVAAGAAIVAAADGRLTLLEGRFSDMERLLAPFDVRSLDGVVMDIGVSSMQIDDAERGFSFAKEGPLDMRMEQAGPSAADLVNGLEEPQLARLIGVLGEEKKAMLIARAIARARNEGPILTTTRLAEIVARAVGRRAVDRIHPATRTFQALRIHVNRELDELAEGLAAAERMLKPGGRLVVVTFHSLEDRIVKRFLAQRSGRRPGPSRHFPPAGAEKPASFIPLSRGHVSPRPEEVAANPRARSAKLRAAMRAAGPPYELDRDSLGLPRLRLDIR
jgi:16S rRNA (cytosine1402-N4)-methyltransferase